MSLGREKAKIWQFILPAKAHTDTRPVSRSLRTLRSLRLTRIEWESPWLKMGVACSGRKQALPIADKVPILGP